MEPSRQLRYYYEHLADKRTYMNEWYRKNAPRLKEKRVRRALDRAREKFTLLEDPVMEELRALAISQSARAQTSPERG